MERYIVVDNVCGVMVSVSNDEVKTWNEPNVIVRYGALDSGYPSSVQLKDGTIVTAYYSKGNPYHTRYHVGVVRWKLTEFLKKRWFERPGEEGRSARFFFGTDDEFIYDWRM